MTTVRPTLVCFRKPVSFEKCLRKGTSFPRPEDVALCSDLGIRFPGHALHEKTLQRQKSVVPLVGSQEQRVLLVPVINR